MIERVVHGTPGFLLSQRGPARQTATALMESGVNGCPDSCRALRDDSATPRAPTPRAAVVSVSPAQDLFLRQRWQGQVVAHAAVFGEQAGQGGARWQSTM